MLALLAFIVLFYAASSANSEEPKWRIASYIAMIDVKPVGDVEGHVAGPYPVSQWPYRIRERAGRREACVALANKNGRYLWLLLARGKHTDGKLF